MADEITTVGLGIDTSGIERGIRSLDDLAARGPKVEKSLDGVEGAAQKAGKAINGIGDGDAGRSLEKTGESAGKAAGKIADLSGSSGKASTAMREVQRSAGALTESLITGGSATGTLATSLSRLAISAPGIGLLVGSIAAVTKAALDGAKEQRNFANALILTGNISGQTVGQLVAYSRAMQDAHTTQGAAAASLAEFVKAGVKGGDMLGDYAKAATDWEKATGQAVGKTAQQFAALQSAPLSAVLKLNDGMNFLTAQSYLAIKALEEQGNTTDAARLAQEEYANAMTSRSSEVQANLGTLEKAWDGVTNAAKKAWDSMLNVGRERTLQDRIADATAAVQAARSALDRAQQQQSGVPSWLRSSTGVDAAQANLSAAERTESDLRTQAALEGTLASARAENAEAVKALAGFETLRSRNLSTDERRQRSQIELATAYQQALDKGNLTEQQRADLEAQYLSAATNITGATQTRAKAVKAAADAYGPLVQRLQSILAVQQLEMQQGEKLTQSQRLQLEIDQQLASGKLKLNEAEKANVSAKLAAIAANEKYKADMAAQVELQKQANKEWDAMSAAYAAIVKAQASSAESVEKSVQRMQDEAQARRMSAAMGISQARAIELVNIKRLEERLALVRGREGQSRHVEEIEREIEARKRLADEIGGKDAYEASAKAAKDAADEWQKTSDSINQSLTDALMRGFESGKDFAKNMRDTVVNMFKTMVLKPVIQMVLNPISMGLAGILGGSSAMAGQGGVGGGLGSLLGLAGNASSAYSLWGGLNSGSGILGSIGSMFGLGSGTGATVAAANGLSALTPVTIGTNSSVVAPVVADATGLAGTGMSSTAMAGVAAAAVAAMAAFGLFRKTVKRGDVLTGTLGVDDGIRSGDLMRKDGFLFGGPDWFVNDTGVSGLDKSIQAQWSASLQTVEQWSKALGLSTDKIEGFTATLGTETLGDHGAIGIRLDKDGTPLSDQEIQAKITEAIRSGSNELAQQLIGTWETSMEEVTRQARNSSWDGDGLYSTVTEQVERSTYTPSEFARDGEQAIDTLQRLGTSIVATNEVFRTLGLTLFDGSLAGADLASKLIDASGGMEQFLANTTSYFQGYYSRLEQQGAVMDSLAKQFDTLNIAMPASRDELRNLVDGLDLTTEAGRDLFAGLMGVQEGFAGVLAAAQEASGLTASSVEQLFHSILTQASSAAEAQMMAADQFKTLFMDSIMNTMISSVSDMLMNSGIQPVLDGVLMNSITASEALVTGGAVAATNMATGGTIAGTATAQGGAIAGSVMAQGGGAAAGAMAQGGGAAGAAMAGGGAAGGARIDDAIARVNNYLSTMVAVLQDPDTQSLIGQVSQAVGGAAGSLYSANVSIGGSGYVAPQVSTPNYSGAASGADRLKNALDDLIKTLDAGIKSLTGDIDDVQQWSFKQSQQFLKDALETAKATGALPDTEAVKKAIDDVNRGIGGTVYASAQEENFAKLMNAGVLAQLKTIAEGGAPVTPSIQAPGGPGAPTPLIYAPAAAGQDTARLQALVTALTEEVKRLQELQREGNRDIKRTANAVNGQTDGMPMLVEVVTP